MSHQDPVTTFAERSRYFNEAIPVNIDIPSPDCIDYSEFDEGALPTYTTSDLKRTNTTLAINSNFENIQECLPPTSLYSRLRHAKISYEALVWTIMLVMTTLAVIDRFTWQLSPRQSFVINGKKAGGDRTEILEGPWTVVFYDIFARISGRYLILATNLQFYTYMNTLHRFLIPAVSKTSWLKWIDMSAADTGRRRVHIWNGIALVVCTLVHIWSVLFPVMLNGYKVQVMPGTLDWPISERNPGGFKDMDPVRENVMLQVDDVWRLALMTVLFVIILPLSWRWMITKLHIGKHLHVFLAVMYFIDIVRRHSHPHSWYINTPFFIAWLLDVATSYVWKYVQLREYQSVRLSKDYILFLWKGSATEGSDSASALLDIPGAAEYIMKLPGTSMIERGHPFTAFHNHKGLITSAIIQESKPDAWVMEEINEEDPDWTHGILLKVSDKPRTPKFPPSVPRSYTAIIADAVCPYAKKSAAVSEKDDAALASTAPVNLWGSFPASMAMKIRDAFQTPPELRRGPIVLAAGGSACAYQIDALQQYVAMCNDSSQSYAPVRLVVLYSCRDEGVAKFIANAFKLTLANLKLAQGMVSVHVGYTGKVPKDGWMLNNLSEGVVSVQTGRLRVAQLVPRNSTVFFSGSSGMYRAYQDVLDSGDCREIITTGALYDS